MMCCLHVGSKHSLLPFCMSVSYIKASHGRKILGALTEEETAEIVNNSDIDLTSKPYSSESSCD